MHLARQQKIAIHFHCKYSTKAQMIQLHSKGDSPNVRSAVYIDIEQFLNLIKGAQEKKKGIGGRSSRVV